MAPYEAFYDNLYCTPTCWNENENKQLIRLDLVQDTANKVVIIHKNLVAAQS